MVKSISLEIFVFLIISSGLTTEKPFSFAAASNLKFTHGAAPLSATYGVQEGHVAGGIDTDGDISGVNNLKRLNRDGTNANPNVLDNTAVTGAGEVFVPKTFSLSAQEPTCEQLRAMWIFSKRQSRAAEMTNEIPTYRDPFSFNVWEPYYSSTRSIGSVRLGPRERSRLPVFGRIISREPQRIYAQRQPLLGGAPPMGDNGAGARLYGAETRPIGGGMRRPTQSRYIGGSNGSASVPAGNAGINQNAVPVQGSFEKLKELIWTERAKELTHQRRAEEVAARAAVLKEISNGQNLQMPYKPHGNAKSDTSPLMDENRSPDNDMHQYVNDMARIPIAQTQRTNHRGGQGRATPRSYSTHSGGQFSRGSQKGGSMFAGNSANQDASGRMLRMRLPAGSLLQDDTKQAADVTANSMGQVKTYPMRQSHFRERNRSLLKEYAPDTFFQRDNRRWPSSNSFAPQPYAKQPPPNWQQRLIEEYNRLVDADKYNMKYRAIPDDVAVDDDEPAAISRERKPTSQKQPPAADLERPALQYDLDYDLNYYDAY